MITATGTPVLVGTDGSVAALHVVEAAAVEALQRHRSLRILYVTPPGPDAGQAARVVAQAAEHARKALPDAAITTAVVIGDLVTVLHDASRAAALLVLGESFRRAESTATLPARFAAGAACPVLVVRGRLSPSGPVVAGVDTSPGGNAALRFAAAEADRRGIELVALHTWRERVSTLLGDTAPMSHEDWSCELEHRRVLAEAVAALGGQYPGLRVWRQVRRGSARRLLADWSRGARLIVVGAYAGRGSGIAPLTSVSRFLVERAACPVVVVPAPSR
ncbi:universal stress protein [Actinoplanes sp. NPDC020271]|uniref:universal stress protein n=1 Tax=Actinoplanes sp. NPDC020271 TaxID=3363896 RepID=UPI0037B3FD85